MSFSMRTTEKRGGKYPGPRYVVVEDGTPNMAIHTNEKEALTSLRYLQEGKARFCDCGNFIVGIRSRVASHLCAASGKTEWQ